MRAPADASEALRPVIPTDGRPGGSARPLRGRRVVLDAGSAPDPGGPNPHPDAPEAHVT